MNEEERLSYIYNDEMHNELLFLLMNLDFSLLSSCPIDRIIEFKKKISLIKDIVEYIYKDPEVYDEDVKMILFNSIMDLFELRDCRSIVFKIKSKVDSLTVWAMEIINNKELKTKTKRISDNK